MADIIYAPFTVDQVKKLKQWQSGFVLDADSPFYVDENGIRLNGHPVHPFTCCGYNGCDRKKQDNEGTLMPTADGWVCPCGAYTQNWCYASML